MMKFSAQNGLSNETGLADDAVLALTATVPELAGTDTGNGFNVVFVALLL